MENNLNGLGSETILGGDENIGLGGGVQDFVSGLGESVEGLTLDSIIGTASTSTETGNIIGSDTVDGIAAGTKTKRQSSIDKVQSVAILETGKKLLAAAEKSGDKARREAESAKYHHVKTLLMKEPVKDPVTGNYVEATRVPKKAEGFVFNVDNVGEQQFTKEQIIAKVKADCAPWLGSQEDGFFIRIIAKSPRMGSANNGSNFGFAAGIKGHKLYQKATQFDVVDFIKIPNYDADGNPIKVQKKNARQVDPSDPSYDPTKYENSMTVEYVFNPLYEGIFRKDKVTGKSNKSLDKAWAALYASNEAEA